MDQKVCAGCREKKPLDAFHRNSRARDGRTPQCKLCRNAANREYAGRPDIATHRRVYNREWGATNPDKARAKKLRHRFGIDEVHYDALLAEQGGVCAICHQTCSRGKRLNVDHDHATGKIRGLLCWACNVGLGKLGDSLAGVEAAAAYLRAAA